MSLVDPWVSRIWIRDLLEWSSFFRSFAKESWFQDSQRCIKEAAPMHGLKLNRACVSRDVVLVGMLFFIVSRKIPLCLEEICTAKIKKRLLDFKTLATPWRFFFPTLPRDLDVSHQNYFINLTLIAYFAGINESNFIISIKN